MSEKLKEVVVYHGKLTGRIYVGFRSKRKPNTVTSNEDATSMTLMAVTSFLMEDGNHRNGEIQFDPDGVEGPESIIVSAEYKTDIVARDTEIEALRTELETERRRRIASEANAAMLTRFVDNPADFERLVSLIENADKGLLAA